MYKLKNELLLIGPRQAKNGKIGGVVVLFENLLLNLDRKQISYIIADSNSDNYSNKLTMFFNVINKIFKVGTYQHISLNGTAKDYLYFSPILLMINIIFGKQFSLRKFAGNFDEYHASLNVISRFFVNLLLKRSSVNFFETQSLVGKFKKFNKNTCWFPNVRPQQTIKSKSYTEGEEFKVLFCSQVSTEKGVLDLINAVKNMENVTLTIAGPISDITLINIEELCPENVKYVGVVDNEAIYDFISDYHCFVLPTYYEGEGYPGAIIEAFMVGLPVISTKWRQIPELVENSGILVEPRSIEYLIKAILDVRRKHSYFQKKSIERSAYFEDYPNTTIFLKKIIS